MTHERTLDLLPWYLNGTLDEREREAVLDELTTCAPCAQEYESMKALATEMRVLEDQTPEPRAEIFERLASRLPARRRPGSPFERFRRSFGALALPWRIAAFASPVLALLLLFALDRSVTPVAYQGGAGGSLEAAAPTADVSQPQAMDAEAAKGAPALGRVSSAVAQNAPAPAIAPKHLPPREIGAQLIRVGSIDVLVADVAEGVRSVSQIALAEHGDVRSLSEAAVANGGARRTASLSVSVPHERFDATVNELAALGRVVARSESAEDVSDQIVDSQARLRNLRHEEGDLLRIMDRSGKISDVLDVEQQLSSVREQIEQLDAQVQSMQNRVAYSSISVTLTAESASAVVEADPFAQLANTWSAATHSAWAFLRTIVATVLWLIAFAPFIAIVAWAGYLLYRRSRRTETYGAAQLGKARDDEDA